jgi:hypothetical protein
LVLVDCKRIAYTQKAPQRVRLRGCGVGYLVKTRSPLKRSSTLKEIDLLKQFIASV